jgi:apolipoprotein N-acyltransferase
MNLRTLVERRFVGSAVALVAGAALTLSYAPFEWWPLAIAAPALLMWLWDGATPRRAAVLGFWFNFGTFSVGTYWLFISLRLIGHAPIPLALLLMLGLAGILGAYHALLGWAAAKFMPARGALRWMVGIPGAWLLIEWWRSWFLTGFGWLALGYAHTDNWLGALAPVIGQYGLGLVTLVMAGALVTLALGEQRARIVAAVTFVVPWGVAFALHGIEWTEPFGQPIEVAVVQGAVPQDEKWITDNLDSIINLYQTRTREAHGAAIIFWPESAVPDLANNHVYFFRDVYAEASARGSSLIMGALRAETNPHTGEEEYFNSVQASPGAVRRILSGAAVRAQLAAAHDPAVFRFQSRRGAASAPARRRTARRGRGLLRRRIWRDTVARNGYRHHARQRHERFLVRSFHRALSALADQPPARDGDRPPHGARRERWGVRRDRFAGPAGGHCPGI